MSGDERACPTATSRARHSQNRVRFNTWRENVLVASVQCSNRKKRKKLAHLAQNQCEQFVWIGFSISFDKQIGHSAPGYAAPRVRSLPSPVLLRSAAGGVADMIETSCPDPIKVQRIRLRLAVQRLHSQAARAHMKIVGSKALLERLLGVALASYSVSTYSISTYMCCQNAWDIS